MGLLKDAIGAATGAGQVSNGFNGPRLSLGGRKTQRNDSPFNSAYSPNRLSSPSRRNLGCHDNDSLDNVSHSQNRRWQSKPDRLSNRQAECNWNDHSNDVYDVAVNKDQRGSDHQGQSYGDDAFGRNAHNAYTRRFRPLVLPQIAFGNGQPFLRGYSDELKDYDIAEGDFFHVLDRINTAIIPNPEVQIFQKGASIAGWFVPGAASLGLIGGRIGVGVGAALGHASLLARALSKANLDVFLPNGLEICIGSSSNVDGEVGISSGTQQRNIVGQTAEEKLTRYGELVAPLSVVLPPSQNIGRQDPLAKIGQRIGDKGNQKKLEKARRDAARGKLEKMGDLEGGLKWLIVRQATRDAIAHWRQTLEQSEAALDQEQQRMTAQH